jgi:hypothetical protein
LCCAFTAVTTTTATPAPATASLSGLPIATRLLFTLRLICRCRLRFCDPLGIGRQLFIAGRARRLTIAALPVAAAFTRLTRLARFAIARSIVSIVTLTFAALAFTACLIAVTTFVTATVTARAIGAAAPLTTFRTSAAFATGTAIACSRLRSRCGSRRRRAFKPAENLADDVRLLGCCDWLCGYFRWFGFDYRCRLRRQC